MNRWCGRVTDFIRGPLARMHKPGGVDLNVRLRHRLPKLPRNPG